MAGNVRESVKGAGRSASAAAERSVKRSRRAIQSRPLTAVGAAVAGGAVVGLVAGAVISRRRARAKNEVVTETEPQDVDVEVDG
ncbi:MAG: hypothetical protein ABSF83_11160 [Nitrososphaerales archaeon]|jgi:ElaB/YqjD/DUF883 family membrane-anchored ribosome-binding protein